MNNQEKEFIKDKLKTSEGFNIYGLVNLGHIKASIYAHLNTAISKEEIKTFIIEEFNEQFIKGIEFIN